MKRYGFLFLSLYFCLFSFGFTTRYSLQFKNKEVVEGELIKDDGVQVTIKLDSGSSIAYYKILLSKMEPSTDYHTRLGDTAFKNEQYADAVKEFELVLQQDPKNDHALKQIAAINNWFQSQAKEKQDKQNEIASALLFSQGMSYFRYANYALASKKFQEVLTYNSNDSSASEYLKLSNEKLQEEEQSQIKSERERIETEKKIQDLQLENLKEKNKAISPPPVSSPVNPGARSGGVSTASGFYITLGGINVSGDTTIAVLDVTSGTIDRELRLQKNESDRVGDYRVRVTNIDSAKNEVTVEVFRAGSTNGETMTLTPTRF